MTFYYPIAYVWILLGIIIYNLKKPAARENVPILPVSVQMESVTKVDVLGETVKGDL